MDSIWYKPFFCKKRKTKTFYKVDKKDFLYKDFVNCRISQKLGTLFNNFVLIKVFYLFHSVIFLPSSILKCLKRQKKLFEKMTFHDTNCLNNKIDKWLLIWNLFWKDSLDFKQSRFFTENSSISKKKRSIA